MNFKAATDGKRPALETFEIPLSAFSPAWADAPGHAELVGLRPLSLQDCLSARAEAAKGAWEYHPNPADEEERWQAFNELLTAWIVARGTCDPLDARKSAPVWRGVAEDVVAEALTPTGVTMVCDAITDYLTARGPLESKVDDFEIVELVALYGQAITRLPGSRQSRIRRLLHNILAELRTVAPVEHAA